MADHNSRDVRPPSVRWFVAGLLGAVPGISYLLASSQPFDSLFPSTWLEFPGHLMGLIAPIGAALTAFVSVRVSAERRVVVAVLLACLALIAGAGAWQFWKVAADLFFGPWS